MHVHACSQIQSMILEEVLSKPLWRAKIQTTSRKKKTFFFRVSKNSRGIVDGRRPITVCGGGGNLLMGKGKSQKKTQQIRHPPAHHRQRNGHRPRTFPYGFPAHYAHVFLHQVYDFFCCCWNVWVEILLEMCVLKLYLKCVC